MADMTVARTILEQLGGNKFKVMTGARDFVGGENFLSFKLPTGRTKNKSNYVRVRLNGLDTYDVEFLSLRGMNSSVKAYKEGVYADQLQAVFTRETGLETSLGTMGQPQRREVAFFPGELKGFHNRHEN